VLALAAAATLACGDDDDAGRSGPTDRVVAIPAKGEGKSAAAAPAELVRATAAMATAAKPASHLGFKLSALSGLYALDGVAAVPTWAAEGTSPEAARDDDALTAFTCDHGGAKPCAIGIGFAEPVTVDAIRMYVAAGPGYGTYRGHPRVAKVRVHTDEGWADATVQDGATHRYVTFAKPVETTSISLEVLGVHKGKKSQRVHVAELEVLGRSGPKRAPLDLDPAAVYTSFETEPWKIDGRKSSIRLAFLDEARAGGSPRRIARGTALLGGKGDRFLLLERMLESDCATVKGSWVLVDQHTRVMLPLGQLGGALADIVRHPDGLGFLIKPEGGDEMSFRGVVLEGDEVKIHRPGSRHAGKVDDLLRKWGFPDLRPLVRGGTVPTAGTVCARAAAGDKLVTTALASAGQSGAAVEQFAKCPLEGGATAIIGSHAACSKRWSVIVVGPGGAIAQQLHGNKDDARGLRLAMLPGVGLVVEISRKLGATADLWRVGSEGIAILAEGASFAVRAPASCDPCVDEWPKGVALAEPVEPLGGETVEPVEPPEPPEPAEPEPAEPPPSQTTAALPSIQDPDPEE
jgi:hypothetical protein